MSSRGKRQLSSKADDVSIATKRRKGRGWAPSQGEEEETPMERERTANNSDMKVSSIYNRSTTDAPAELFRKDLISAMKLPDSEPLAPEDYWLISDQWKQEWERGVQVPVNPDSLPSPVSAPSQLIIRPRHPFKLPKNKYIRLTKDAYFRIDDHYLSNVEMQSNMSCSYDSDELDIAWLNIMNKERLAMNLAEITRDQMESVIEELEMRCWQKVNDIIKKEEGLALEFDESVVCDVCRSPDSEDGNEMVFCDCCNICVHQACYGITTIPAGSWLCRTCALGLRPECVLCPNKNGAMKSTRSGQKWAHVSCALWIPEVSIGCVEKMEPITKISGIPQSRWALICVLCRERVGACIQCSVKTCKTAYHVTCAFKHGLEMRAIIEDESTSEDDNTVKLRSYCGKHSITSKKEQNEPQSDEESRKKHPSSSQRKEISSEEKNQARAAKLSEVEAEFEKYVTIADVSAIHEVDDEAIRFIYSYWILKRRAAFNKPLLPAKTEDTSLMYRNEEEHLDQERIKMFVQLRQDLERVRNLCYMVSRREKLSRSFLKLREQTFYKQATILSNPAITLDLLELEAIKNANRNASIYDKLYSSVWDKDPCPDLELMVSRIAGHDRTEERIRIRNNGAMTTLDNITNGINGGMYSDEHSLYSNLSSTEMEDIHPDPDYKRYPLLNAHPRKREQKRLKRKDRPRSKLDIHPSSDDENRTTENKKSRTLKKMVEELRSSEDTDDFEIIKINFKYEPKKPPKDIYSSDTDSNISLKDSGIYSDLQKGSVPTKASVKDFAKNQLKGNKETMKKVDELFEEIKQDTAKRKAVKEPPVVPPDLIVPQRKAAKKAETIFKSQTRRKSSESLSDEDKVLSKKPLLPDTKKKVVDSKTDKKMKLDKVVSVKKLVPISQKVATKKPIQHGKNGMIKEDRIENKDIKPNIINFTSTTTTQVISVVRMKTEQVITGKKIGNCSSSSSSSSSSNSSSGSSSSSSSSSSSGSSSGSSSSSSCTSDSDDEVISKNRMSSKPSNISNLIDKNNKDIIKPVPIVNKIKPMPKSKKKELELQEKLDVNNKSEENVECIIPSNIKIEDCDIKPEREPSIEKIMCDYRHSLFSPPKDIATTSDFLGLGNVGDNDKDLFDMPNLSFHEFVLKEDSKEDTNRETLDLVDKLRKGMAQKVNSSREKMENMDDVNGPTEIVETDEDTSVTISSGDVTMDNATDVKMEEEKEKPTENKETSRFTDDTPSELCIDPSRQKLDRCDTGQSDERWVPPSEYEAESPSYMGKWSDSVVMPSRRSNCSSSSSTLSENQTKIEETQSQVPIENTESLEMDISKDPVVPISELPDKEESIPETCLAQPMPQLDPIAPSVQDVHDIRYSPMEKPLEVDTDMALPLPNVPAMEKGIPNMMMGLGPSQKCIPDVMHFPQLQPFPHFSEHHFPYSNSSTFLPQMNMYPPPHSNPLPYPTPGTIFPPSFTAPFPPLHSFSSKQLDEAFGPSHNLAYTASMVSPLAKVLEESSRPMPPYDPFAIGNCALPSDISNCSFPYNNSFDICPVPPPNDNLYSKSDAEPYSNTTNNHKEFSPTADQALQINCVDHQLPRPNSCNDFLLKPVEPLKDEATTNVPKTESNQVTNDAPDKLVENSKPINEISENNRPKEEPIKITDNENPPQSSTLNSIPESKSKVDDIILGSPGLPLTPASSNKVHGFNKKSPAKPTRISARVLSQGKSPAKSPAVNQSPQQMTDTKNNKGINKKNKAGSRTGQGNSRGRGRGRGRGRNTAFVCRDSELEIQSKLVGTVYDLDFDDDIGSESVENLKSMRNRRKSSDLHEARFNEKPRGTPKYISSPKFSSPARSERKKSSRTPNTEEISTFTVSKKDTTELPDKEVEANDTNIAVDNEPHISEKFAEVEPLLPGPVDMRRYNTYSEPLTPCSSYTNSVLGTFSTSSVEEVPTILADLEKELRSHTNVEEPTAENKSNKSDSSVIIIDDTDTPPPSEDSRNQLKVKIKGPMGHLDSNYPISIIPQRVAPILPSTPIIDLTLPSTGGSSVTGSTNLRRMRKKELLHQYWNQDMNMDESTAGAITMNHVAAKTTTISPPRQVITIPKAVASMTSIPTKEDYRAVLDANMEKKKRKEYQQNESHNSYQIMDDMDRIRTTNGPIENSIIRRKGTTPKLKIKFGGTPETIIEPFVTPIMEEKNLRLRPPKKRLCEPEQQPMPTMEELKRDSMKYRCKVMSEFEGNNDVTLSGGKKRKKKSNGEKSTKHKKRNSIRLPHVQVIETTEFVPKLIIRFGHKNHINNNNNNNNNHNHNSNLSNSKGGPSPMADVATCAAVPNNSDVLQPTSVRTSKISPIRLKLSRHKEGYIMKSCDTLPETCAESNYTCNINN